MMHDLMAGMFWGGLVMAVPPIAASVWIVLYLIRSQQEEARSRLQERDGSRSA